MASSTKFGPKWRNGMIALHNNLKNYFARRILLFEPFRINSDPLMEKHGTLPIVTNSITISVLSAYVHHWLHREHVKCLYWKSTTHRRLTVLRSLSCFFVLALARRRAILLYILFYSARIFFARATYFVQSVLLSYTTHIAVAADVCVCADLNMCVCVSVCVCQSSLWPVSQSESVAAVALWCVIIFFKSTNLPIRPRSVYWQRSVGTHVPCF